MKEREYKEIKVGDKLYYHDKSNSRSSNFTDGNCYIVKKFYENKYGITFIDDNNDTHDVCKQLVLQHFSRLNNKVEHPLHYTWLKDKCGIEVIDITRHMDFDLGNAIKYILRAGHKSEEGYSNKDKTIEDLKKAVWYINDKIKTLENENN